MTGPQATTTPAAGVTWRLYYYAGAQRVAERVLTSSSNKLYYLHSDHLGSTSAVTCGNTACGTVGNAIARQYYYPFGGVRPGGTGTVSAATPADYGFTGQTADASTGLMYYSLSNPLKYTDPSGHRPDDGCRTEGCTPDALLGVSADEVRLMTRYYYEKSLPWGELQDSGDNWVDAGFDWLLENGPADRQFGPDSPMTQSLMTGRGAGQARDAYYAARASGQAPPVGKPFRYRYDFGPLEFLMAWLPPNGTSHFLGSYDVFITDQGDGSLNFSVSNVTNWASGTNLRVPGTEAPLFSEELRPTGPHDILMPTYSIPFKTILPGWQRGESFYGAANLGGAYTQSYVWNEPLTVAPAQP